MFELKNFFVKKRGQTLIENLNFKFFSSTNFLVKYKTSEQKNAFIQGIIGNPEYETSGKILWDCKWKVEDKPVFERCQEKFYWLSDFSPRFESIKTRDYLDSFSTEKKYLPLFKTTHLDVKLLEEKLYDDWRKEDCQKFKLLEIYLLRPKNIFLDQDKPNEYILKELSEYQKKHSASIFVFRGDKAKINFHVNKTIIL